MVKKNNFWIVILFLVLTTAFFAKALFTKTTFIYGDTYLLYYPIKFFLATNLKKFYLPQWNPYIACGMPTVSDPIQQIFYPLTILLLIFKFNLGYKLFIISHYFIAGITAYILMRGLKCRTSASIFSGIAFMFCGYMVFNHSNPIYISSAAWMPLAFYSFIKIFSEKRKFFWSLNCSFLIGIQILAGDFQLIYGELWFFLIYVLWNLRESKVIVLKYLIGWSLKLILILFFAFLFSAVLILPMYFLFPFSDRSSGYTFQEATKWSFHPLRIIEFLTPYIFGNITSDNNYWGMFLQNQKVERVWTEVIYIGIFPLIFSMFGFLMRRDKHTNYFLLLFGLSLVLAFGSYTPLYFILYKTAPFFNSLRYPEKFLIFSSFSLAILGGIGFEKYLSIFSDENKEELLKKGMKIIKTISLCIILLLFLALSFNIYLKFDPSSFKKFLLKENINLPLSNIASSVKGASLFFFLISSLSVAGIWLGLKGKISSKLLSLVIILILIVDLWQVGLKSYFLFREDYYDFTPVGKLVIDKIEGKKSEYFRIHHSDKFIKGYKYPEFQNLSAYEKTWIFDKNTLKPATGVNFKIFHADHYGSFQLKTQKELLERLKGKEVSFNLLNIKYIFEPKDLFGKTPYPISFIHPKGDFIIFKNPSLLPRAFIVRKAKTYSSDKQALDIISSHTFKPEEVVILPEKTLMSLKLLKEHESGEIHSPYYFSGDKCEIIDYKPNCISFRVDLKEPAFLVLLENFFPGWEAKVNGIKRDIIEADYAFMGIPIDPGTYRVEMNFTHPGFPTGLKLTSFSFVFYLLFLLLHFVIGNWVQPQ